MSLSCLFFSVCNVKDLHQFPSATRVWSQAGWAGDAPDLFLRCCSGSGNPLCWDYTCLSLLPEYCSLSLGCQQRPFSSVFGRSGFATLSPHLAGCKTTVLVLETLGVLVCGCVSGDTVRDSLCPGDVDAWWQAPRILYLATGFERFTWADSSTGGRDELTHQRVGRDTRRFWHTYRGEPCLPPPRDQFVAEDGTN